MNYKYLSFFSGAMGLDLGLEYAGWHNVFAIDNDKNMYNTMLANKNRLNNPDTKIVLGDIRNYTADDILLQCGLEKKDIFAIVGGPPCQAFSSAGKRQGLSDERGNVFIKYLEIIKDILPKYIVIENVRGLLSTSIDTAPVTPFPISIPTMLLKHKHGLILLLMEQLKLMGYNISFTLYDTSRYGVPQIRERVVIIGHLGGEKVPLIPPTHFSEREPKLLTLKDAIYDLRDKEHHYNEFPVSRLKYYKLLKEGQNWRSLPEELQKEALGKSFYLGGGKTGFYRRLAWDKPSPTLVTSPSNFPATDLCHPEELRPLSIEEYARIQQFPDEWVFFGSIGNIYKQIGNAVPVGFGKVVGKHILDFEQGILSNKEDFDRGLFSGKEDFDYSTSRYRNTSHIFFEDFLHKQLSLLLTNFS